MTSKLIISIFFYLSLVSAAPVEPNIVSWEGEPDGRGTWSILSSCILTLVLCVYTAVHMNIPAASQTVWQRRKHIAGWVCAGIFAPELVLWTAWSQWSEARELTQEIKEIEATLKTDPEKQSVRVLLESWTIKHSFFVIMGGYQFRPEVLAEWFADERFWTGWRQFLYMDKRQPKCVLTSEGLIELLKHDKGHKLPALTVKDIDDRSKADKLAKLLSCVQGLWLLIQIISRLASHLTITELEVNTLAHVICAVGMYTFWMKKPLNIEQPVWLEDDYLKDWASVITSMPRDLASSWSNHQERIRRRSQMADRELRITTHKFHPFVSPEDCETCRKNGLISASRKSSTLVVWGSINMDLEGIIEVTIISLNSRPNGIFCFDFVSSETEFPYAADDARYPHLRIGSGELDAFLKFDGQPENVVWLDMWANAVWKSSPMLRRCSRMVRSHYMDKTFELCVMILTSSLYGGLHASLWHHHFPTVAELWMWRISSLVVAGNGLVLALFMMFGISVFYYEERLEEGLQPVVGVHQIYRLLDDLLGFLESLSEYTDIPRYFRYLLLTVFSVVQFIFVFCRIFLFIEAFVSLRSQPEDAYDTPNWSQWLPHL